MAMGTKDPQKNSSGIGGGTKVYLNVILDGDFYFLFCYFNVLIFSFQVDRCEGYFVSGLICVLLFSDIKACTTFWVETGRTILL